MKKVLIIFFTLILIFQNLLVISAATPYKSYNYSGTNNGIFDVAAPDAYVPETVLYYESLGIPAGTYEDIFIDLYRNCYIVDSTGNAVYVFDPSWKLIRTISSFDNNGRADTFKNPTGVCVTAKREIYIADTNNDRIVILDADGKLLSIINTPKEEVLGSEFVFKPLKIAVSKSGRIFVVAKDVFEGLMEMTLNGQFLGFVGSNKVVVSPIDLFWKKVFSQKQNEASKAFIPVEYTNISLDSYGFIYAVTSVKDVDAPIKRLNPSGNDVLTKKPTIQSLKVAGDYIAIENSRSNSLGPSSFVDIVSDDKYGIYYALDNNRGRVFAYDGDGNILYIFGGAKSDQKGTFFLPSAVEIDNDKVVVLDKGNSSVTVFRTSDYAETLKRALISYDNGEYEKSYGLWQDVLKCNSNLNLAYVKVGFCLYRMGRYKEAMDSFILANAREQYSKAFVKYSRGLLEKNFGYYATVLIIIIAAVVLFSILLKKRKRIKAGEGNGNESV